MKNLVGVRITDTVEQAWIGQSSLERVALGAQTRRELLLIGLENLHAAACEVSETLLAGHQVDRSSSLGARLGQQEHAGWKLEGSEPYFAWWLRPRRLPAQTTGDHEVNNHEQLIFQLEHDVFAHAPKHQYSIHCHCIE